MTRPALSLLLALTLLACKDTAPAPDSADPADADVDGDGFTAESDCNDDDAGINPDAPELCDGVDNNCDGVVDEDAADAATWYPDGDGDGYGGPDALIACEAPPGAVAQGGDCDDGDAAFYPGAPEDDCTDPNDYNCDGSVGYADADGDGFPACEECNDQDAALNPAATEVCDGLDNDCDGLVDDEDDSVDVSTGGTFYADVDGDSFGDAGAALQACELPEGASANSEDCDDSNADVNPDATELCNGLDDNCDGSTDGPDSADIATWYDDDDGDGYGDIDDPNYACEQPSGAVADATDCDDNEANAYPGNTEVCDGIDNDCNGDIDGSDASGQSTWYDDDDGDGYGDPDDASEACAAPSGSVSDDSDCDDGDSAVNPAATEVCDGIDNDCDGSTDGADASGQSTWYADSDGDGYGDASVSSQACDAPTGAVSDSSDCDDGDGAVNPGATEVCDGIDNNCDGNADGADASGQSTWYADSDGDGYGDASVSSQACDAPSGTVSDDSDCDDGDSAVNPVATEICDGIDNNCDGNTDGADASGQSTWYADSDGDGYGDASVSSLACDAPSGTVSDDSDCDDGDSAVNPVATEICDGVDNNCDGSTDGADASGQSTWYADGDGDGYGDASVSSQACDAPTGTVSDSSDCDDGDSAVNPAATEVCDSVDNDCNGTVDDISSGVCLEETCLGWLIQGYTSSGVYVIDPEGNGTGVDAYCDMDSDGGGWTLVAWTEDSTQSPLGVPYPSLAQCPALNCARGSSGDEDMLNALINLSGELGVGHTTTAISQYQDLEDYQYSGTIDYGSLAGFYIDPYNPTSCDTSGFATGTFTSISGPSTYDGTTLYLAQSFRYTSSYGDFDESTRYIWLLGTTSGYCGGNGNAPAVYLGNWSTSEREYGPYLTRTAGARAVYVR